MIEPSMSDGVIDTINNLINSPPGSWRLAVCLKGMVFKFLKKVEGASALAKSTQPRLPKLTQNVFC